MPGSLSRRIHGMQRDGLTRNFAPTALVLAVALMAAACGGGTPESQPGATPPAASVEPATAPAQPAAPAADAIPVPPGDFTLLGDPRAVKGGKIVLDTNSYPTHMNFYGPDRDANTRDIYAEAMFNTLITIHKSTLEYVPELANKWEEIDGGKELIFHIDPDARWSDGQPVVANDVVATFNLMMHPKVAEVVLSGEFKNRFPTPPVAIDERTVKFVAAKPSWRNLVLIDDLFILPAHKIDPETYIDEWHWKPPVVSGAYDLGDYDTGKYVTLVRRKDFWGEGKRQFVGLYNFDTVYEKVNLEDDISFETFKKGDIDFYFVAQARRWVEETDFDKVQKGWIKKQKYVHREPQVPSQWVFNLKNPIFQDKRVRKGLHFLLNRDIVIDQIQYNLVERKDSYYQNSIYQNKENALYPFDPRKGLELLKEAGWYEKDTDGTLIKDGKRLEFDFQYIHKMAEPRYTPLQETYRKYGIKMNLRLISPSAWIKVLNSKEFDVVYMNWAPASFPEPRQLWHSSEADKEDSYNVAGFKNAQVDALIDEYDAKPSLEDRAKAIQGIDAILTEAVPYMLDYYSDNFRIMWWDKFGMPEWVTFPTIDPRYGHWQTWWYDAARAEALQKAMQSGAELPKVPVENTYWRTHGK
ncbi:MAG: ABC transporter substrate-binding protein [Candidatus Schekmanbacteria bacterium]|nr:ABC transporter substrate-binding protein [Candidatus Schekmanbacteria bacterium]